MHPEDFWSSTPRRIFAILKRHTESEKRANQLLLNTAFLCASFYNANRSSDAAPLQHTDFLPSDKPRKTEDDDWSWITPPEQQLATFKLLAANHNAILEAKNG